MSVALAAIVAGCITSPAKITPTTAPTAIITSAGISAASLFDHSKFTWYQYKISSSDMMGMSMVHTYRYSQETVDGTPAIHANITMDMRPETLIYLDIWSRPPDDTVLKIHEIVYKMGNRTKDIDIDPGNYSKFAGEDLASPSFTEAVLSPSGTESVTANNKTFAATKYSGGTSDTQYVYWTSPGVPMPVKFTVHDKELDSDSTFELTGWG